VGMIAMGMKLLVYVVFPRMFTPPNANFKLLRW